MKNFYRIIILTVSLLLLCSCASEEKRCEDIALSLCAELELPAGQLYCKDESAEPPRTLPADTVKIMYGNEGERVFGLLEDYAIYLCETGMPYEVAVFRTYSVSESDSVALLCLERADTLSVLLRDGEYADTVRNAKILSRGRYTVMVIAPDFEKAEEIAERLIK